MAVPSGLLELAGSKEPPADASKALSRRASMENCRQFFVIDPPSKPVEIPQKPTPEQENQRQDKTAKPSICPNCKAGSRNLVVCIDGTSKKFGTNNTNIVALYSQIQKNDQQLTYYTSGIGTYAKPSWRLMSYWRHLLLKQIDSAIAWNLESTIMGAYRWLADNYKQGDKIFLFGFSRGAYQARALAAMIDKVGLLLPGNTEQIPFAFELYAYLDGVGRRTSIEQHVKAAIFKKTFCRSDVSVHFVGAWDTVSSVGFRGRILPFTASSTHICTFRHALALDELRVKFLPEYVNTRESALDSDRRATDVKEVWFPGSHSDVGGGSRPNRDLKQTGMSLRWMRNEAKNAGLLLEKSVEGDTAWLKDFKTPLTKSLNWRWWLLEILPLWQLTYDRTKGTKYTRAWHLGRPRFILPEQKIHVSGLFRDDYIPKAQFRGGWSSWPERCYWTDPTSQKRLKELLTSDWEEQDIFQEAVVQAILRELIPTSETEQVRELLDRLTLMAGFRTGFKNVGRMHRKKLLELLDNDDIPVRLNTAIALCELNLGCPYYGEIDPDGKFGSEIEWRDLLDEEFLGKLREVVQFAVKMLTSAFQDDRIRACSALPSFSRRKELKQLVANSEIFGILLRSASSHRNSDVRDQSIQALSSLLQTDVSTSVSWLEGNNNDNDWGEGKFHAIIKFLDSKNQRVVASILRLLTAFTTNDESRGQESVGRRMCVLQKKHDVLRKVKKVLGNHATNPYVLSSITDWVTAIVPHDTDNHLISSGVLSGLSGALEDRLVNEQDSVAKYFLRILRIEKLAEKLLDDGLMERLFQKLLYESSFREAAKVITKLMEIKLVDKALTEACKYIIPKVLEKQRLKDLVHTLGFRFLFERADVQLAYALSKLLHNSFSFSASILNPLLSTQRCFLDRIRAMISDGLLFPGSPVVERLHIDGTKVIRDILSADANLRKYIVNDEYITKAAGALTDAKKELIGGVNLFVVMEFYDLREVVREGLNKQIQHLATNKSLGVKSRLHSLVNFSDVCVALELTPISPVIIDCVKEWSKDAMRDQGRLPDGEEIMYVADILAYSSDRERAREIVGKLANSLEHSIQLALQGKKVTADKEKSLRKSIEKLKKAAEQTRSVSGTSLSDRVRKILPNAAKGARQAIKRSNSVSGRPENERMGGKGKEDGFYEREMRAAVNLRRREAP